MSLLAGNSTGSVTGNSAGNSAGNLSGDTTGPGWIRRLWAYIARHRRELRLSLTGALIGGACQVVVPLVERQIVDGVDRRPHLALWPWLAADGAARRGRLRLRLPAPLPRRPGGARGPVRPAQRHARPPAVDGLRQPRPHADRSAGRPGQLRLDPGAGPAQLLPDHERQRAADGAARSPSCSTSRRCWPSSAWSWCRRSLVVSYRMRWRVFPATWDGQQREGDVVQIVDEDVNGVRVVKAFGQEQRELRAGRPRRQRCSTAPRCEPSGSRRATSRSCRPSRPSARSRSWPSAAGWPCTTRSPSARSWPSRPTSPSWSRRPGSWPASSPSAQQARAGVERIFQLLDLKPGHRRRARRRRAARGPRRGRLRRRPLRLRRRTQPVLHGLRPAQSRAGERVALVGPSGSGKSTAPCCCCPASTTRSRGAVLVDGHDVRDVTLASLRRQVGVVFEESFLFSDSVRANIAYGAARRHRSTEIEAAARAAGAHEFIERLPAWLRHDGRRAGPDPLGRPAAADRAGPGAAVRPARS